MIGLWSVTTRASHYQGAPRTLAREDWTIAFDDCLVARHGHCTLCGAGSLTWVWGWARPVYGVDIGISLCHACHRQDPAYQRVDALLNQRYDPARWGQLCT